MRFAVPRKVLRLAELAVAVFVAVVALLTLGSINTQARIASEAMSYEQLGGALKLLYREPDAAATERQFAFDSLMRFHPGGRLEDLSIERVVMWAPGRLLSAPKRFRLVGGDFSEVTLSRSAAFTFDGGAELRRVALQWPAGRSAELTFGQVGYGRAVVSESVWRDRTLSLVNFFDVELRGVLFDRIRFCDVGFDRAAFTDVVFDGASFGDCGGWDGPSWFERLTLERAGATDFGAADLAGARFRNMELSRVDLSAATGLTAESFEEVCLGEDASLPEGLSLPPCS